MGFEIDDDILKAAVACGKGHMCVSRGQRPYCSPVELMRGEGQDAALIECPEDRGCPYCQSFGETHICQCPVRLEILRRYGV